jgi:catechol 2,3-dioxygenase-like lactoylglutathione lyase family enzyme
MPPFTTKERRLMDFKLEVVVIPVSDVDKAKHFYATGLACREEADIAGPGIRVVQMTPPGSACSIHFGVGVTSAAPGSTEGLVFVVDDIEKARAELVDRGVDVSDVFHDAGGGYNRFDPGARASGPDPQRRTYASFATFRDPDGNSWFLQEITHRLPGGVTTQPTYSSASDLADAMRRASVAHGKHEERIGHADPDWPDWYAEYITREQAGEGLPT